jgi:LPXTG-motif cell wall-anchored protein
LLASQTIEPSQDSTTPAGLPKTGLAVVNSLVLAITLLLMGLYFLGIRRRRIFLDDV